MCATVPQSSKVTAPRPRHYGASTYLLRYSTNRTNSKITLTQRKSWRKQHIPLYCAPHATITQRITFLHNALGSPALSTICQVLDAGYLTFMPEITMTLVRKYPPPSIVMIKGHLDQVCMNQRST